MADGIAIRQRGPALRAEVHGSGSFVWGDKGWGFCGCNQRKNGFLKLEKKL
jgi:hypothetical protein